VKHMADEKRKHVTLSIEQKLTILEKIAGGASLTTIAKDYGIGKSTVSDIKKNEDKLKSFAVGMETFSIDSKSRKIMRLPKIMNWIKPFIYGLYRKEAKTYQSVVHC